METRVLLLVSKRAGVGPRGWAPRRLDWEPRRPRKVAPTPEWNERTVRFSALTCSLVRSFACCAAVAASGLLSLRRCELCDVEPDFSRECCRWVCETCNSVSLFVTFPSVPISTPLLPYRQQCEAVLLLSVLRLAHEIILLFRSYIFIWTLNIFLSLVFFFFFLSLGYFKHSLTFFRIFLWPFYGVMLWCSLFQTGCHSWLRLWTCSFLSDIIIKRRGSGSTPSRGETVHLEHFAFMIFLR